MKKLLDIKKSEIKDPKKEEEEEKEEKTDDAAAKVAAIDKIQEKAKFERFVKAVHEKAEKRKAAEDTQADFKKKALSYIEAEWNGLTTSKGKNEYIRVHIGRYDYSDGTASEKQVEYARDMEKAAAKNGYCMYYRLRYGLLTKRQISSIIDMYKEMAKMAPRINDPVLITKNGMEQVAAMSKNSAAHDILVSCVPIKTLQVIAEEIKDNKE